MNAVSTIQEPDALLRQLAGKYAVDVPGNWRLAANADDALRITEIAYRAGATTNIEVVQAQQTARNAEILASLAQDRLLQARLGLLVALGEFP